VVTRTSSKVEGKDAVKLGDSLGEARRDLIIKVRVNAAEKAEIARQKARLSFSAFLRDRGVNQGQVYDPTYAAIGSVYQSARTLRDSAAHHQDTSVALQNLAVVLTRLGTSAHDGGNTLKTCEELLKLATSLKSQGQRIENQASELGKEARELGRKHMREMLRRYPAKAIRSRDRR